MNIKPRTIPINEDGSTIVPKAAIDAVQGGAVTVSSETESVTLHPRMTLREFRAARIRVDSILLSVAVARARNDGERA